MYFSGSHTASVASGARLTLPKAVVQELQKVDDRREFKLTINLEAPQRLLLYPMPAWAEVESQLSKIRSNDKKGQWIKWRLSANAHTVTWDAQGRILLPQTLREHIGLDKEVTVSGNGNKFELWDAAVWRAYMDAEQNFDELPDSPEVESLNI